MIRRIVWYGDRGRSMVMWALVAAVLSLSVRYYAVHTLAARATAAASVAEQPVHKVQSPAAGRGAS